MDDLRSQPGGEGSGGLEGRIRLVRGVPCLVLFSSARLPSGPCVSATQARKPPTPSLLDSIPQGGPKGRTMAADPWRTALSSKEAEKDILILETNGNSSVVETHRPT